MNAPHYSKIHNRFLLNGFHYDQEALKSAAYSFVKEGNRFEQYMGDFLFDWLNPSDTIFLETSGTTSHPKRMEFSKQALVNSAITTGDHFKITVGDRSLHCLPARYIAGKMMLIRSMVLGLSMDLVSPNSNPMEDNKKKYDFAAMTPMQAFNSMSKLQQIRTLIIGGGVVSEPLQKKLLENHINAFETYGMTETLSHIAIRKMTDPRGEFKTLSNIKIKQDERGCLVVDAPLLFIHNLVTNDVIEMINPTHFRLIGRIDNVINSGGVKIHPETLERKLDHIIKLPFFVGSLPDPVLGEKLILAVESKDPKDLDDLVSKIQSSDLLESVEKPKSILMFENFQNTFSGKLIRKDTLNSQPIKVSDL